MASKTQYNHLSQYDDDFDRDYCNYQLHQLSHHHNQLTPHQQSQLQHQSDGAFGMSINLEQYISKRNERERSRVRNVNHAFDNLKSTLPLEMEKMSKRMSKVEILRTAINYIRDLEEILGKEQHQQHQRTQTTQPKPQAKPIQPQSPVRPLQQPQLSIHSQPQPQPRPQPQPQRQARLQPQARAQLQQFQQRQQMQLARPQLQQQMIQQQQQQQRLQSRYSTVMSTIITDYNQQNQLSDMMSVGMKDYNQQQQFGAHRTAKRRDSFEYPEELPPLKRPNNFYAAQQAWTHY